MLHTMKFGLVVGCAALIVGCGGGGGSVPIPAAKAPTVSISLSAAKVAVNAPVTVTWASTDASSCVGTDALPATQPINGSASVTQAAGGQFTYTITCTGAGGSATAKVTGIVPMKVFATSYENKNSIPFDATQVPTVRALNIPKVYLDEQDSNERSVAFGDFFQDGTYSAFVSVNRASNLYGIPDVADIPGIGYVLSLDKNGKWVDRTAELLKTTDGRKTCVSSSYSIVVDFNNDGKPDIFISCTGLDYTIPGADPAIYLSNQVLFLSQPDGSYKRTEVPYTGYSHQSAAADVNGDGFMDIVVADANSISGPVMLLGHGDGTFTVDNTIIPKNLQIYTGGPGTIIGGVQLIPIDSRLDVVFGGNGNTIWLQGNKLGSFDIGSTKIFQIPGSVAKGVPYQTPLDVVYIDNMFYFYTTSQWNVAGVEWAIIKFNLDAVTSSVIYTFNNPTATLRPYSAQIKPTSDGHFVAYTGGCPASGDLGMCTMKVKR